MTFSRLLSLTLSTFSLALLIAFVAGGVLVSLFFPHEFPFPFSKLTKQDSKVCNYDIQRIEEHTLVKPLLSVEPACESELYAPLKKTLDRQVEALKAAGAVTDVSVYLHDFRGDRWMSLNDEMSYHPASLMKVPLMMSYLRMVETQPELLRFPLKLTPEQLHQVGRQFYVTQQIEPGKTYTIHELLFYMGAHSDNRASWLLASRQNFDQIQHLFSVLGLKIPATNEMDYQMTARQYSVFFKALYNSSYLSPVYSQYAAEILSNCAFQEGFAKGLPSGTRMWRKFGEWQKDNRVFELHESGIVYIDNHPYLLTIMTRGQSREGLIKALQTLSKNVHDAVVGP